MTRRFIDDIGEDKKSLGERMQKRNAHTEKSGERPRKGFIPFISMQIEVNSAPAVQYEWNQHDKSNSLFSTAAF